MILPNRVTEWVNSDGYCFGCKERLGAPHKPNCSGYQRTVVVEVKIPLIITVPVSWDNEQIEFHYSGEGSHCMSYLIKLLTDTNERMLDSEKCLCYLPEDGDGISLRREATEEDHKKFNVPLPQNIEDLP